MHEPSCSLSHACLCCSLQELSLWPLEVFEPDAVRCLGAIAASEHGALSRLSILPLDYEPEVRARSLRWTAVHDGKLRELLAHLRLFERSPALRTLRLGGVRMLQQVDEAWHTFARAGPAGGVRLPEGLGHWVGLVTKDPFAWQSLGLV